MTLMLHTDALGNTPCGALALNLDTNDGSATATNSLGSYTMSNCLTTLGSGAVLRRTVRNDIALDLPREDLIDSTNLDKKLEDLRFLLKKLRTMTPEERAQEYRKPRPPW